MKYKIAAAINLLLGVVQIIYPTIAFLFIIPQITTLYDQLNIKPNLLLGGYIALVILFAMGISNLFLSFKLFTGSGEIKNKYFKYSLILIAITFILTGIFVIIAQVTTISAIYTITQEF